MLPWKSSSYTPTSKLFRSCSYIYISLKSSYAFQSRITAICNSYSIQKRLFLLTAAQLPEMRTNLTIVYETRDLPAGSCLYSFNVTLTLYMDSFRDKIQSTCNLLDTGRITIESLRLSALTFQVLISHVYSPYYIRFI